MDREKVIRGLECRLDINGSKYKHCLICDYRHDIDHCQWACQTDGILEDALALLKVQEPRVMTLEEYDAWADIPFTERDPIFHEERTERGPVTCWVNTTVCSLCEYGKNDRCWTSRPTDEQREAEPWNAQK